MASAKQKAAARRNIKKAQAARRKGRKRSTSKRKKGKTRRTYGSRVTSYAKKQAQNPISFATNVITAYIAAQPVFEAYHEAQLGETATQKAFNFLNQLTVNYTGYDWGDGTFDINRASGLGAIGNAIGYKMGQSLIAKKAPIRSLIPGPKQGVVSWASSVGARLVSNVPIITTFLETPGDAYSDDTAGQRRKASDRHTMFSYRYTGLIYDANSGAYTGAFDINGPISGYAPVAGAYALKWGTSFLNKKISLKMPRLS